MGVLPSLFTAAVAASHAILWPSWNWKDFHHLGFGSTTLRVSPNIQSHGYTHKPWPRPENFRNRVLELNASDERGITVVREKIKNFAGQTPRATPHDSNYPCPPYKIIILDEADSMTQDAQGALRRIMEKYARITRFCLVCNYVTRYALTSPS